MALRTICALVYKLAPVQKGRKGGKHTALHFNYEAVITSYCCRSQVGLTLWNQKLVLKVQTTGASKGLDSSNLRCNNIINNYTFMNSNSETDFLTNEQSLLIKIRDSFDSELNKFHLFSPTCNWIWNLTSCENASPKSLRTEDVEGK